MKTRFFHFLAMALTVAVVAGCKSPASHFYTLNTIASGSGTNDLQGAVFVGPVTVPADVDRPQFMLRVGPNELAIDEFNRWAEPLNNAIARAVAGDLSSLLGTSLITAFQVSGLKPVCRVSINIQRFESVPGKSVLVDALWVVRKASDGAAFSGHTVATEPVHGNGFDELAAAHSRALAEVSKDIAAVIRIQLEEKP